MINSFANGATFVGICSMISTAFWLFNAIYSIYLFKAAHKMWKSGKGISKLKKDVKKAAADSLIDHGDDDLDSNTVRCLVVVYSLLYSYTHTLIYSYTHILIMYSYIHVLICSYIQLIYSYTIYAHNRTHICSYYSTHTLLCSYTRTHTLIYSYTYLH